MIFTLHGPICTPPTNFIISPMDIDIDIFVNCNWVNTRWQ